MNLELAKLNDERVMLVSDRPMPDIVQRVEYYREQRLFSLVWFDESIEDELLHHEIPIDLAMSVDKAPNIIICALFPEQKTLKYSVPLVKIGEVY